MLSMLQTLHTQAQLQKNLITATGRNEQTKHAKKTRKDEGTKLVQSVRLRRTNAEGIKDLLGLLAGLRRQD